MRSLVALIAASALLAVSPARLGSPGAAASLAFRELRAPVRIVTDRYGVPHVRAANLPDLYFAWGWVSARDRLWQMLERREAVRGRLWRWRGNAALEADGAAQLFEFDAIAARLWEHARRDSAAILVERYCAGVNAYLGQCRRGERPWPPEIRRLGARPDDWTPRDVAGAMLALGASLDLSFPQLAERAEIAKHGMEWYARRHRFDRLWPYETIPDGAARRVEHARAAERVPPAIDPGPRLLAEARRALGPERLDPARDRDERASNVFAVGPRRSASGCPLLANDPHLGLTTPDPLHVIHVSVPGVIDAAGAYAAGLPCLVIGRNARCAWGVTSLSASVTDVWADSLSRDGRRVLWHGRWEPIREAPFDLRLRVLGARIPVGWLGRLRRYTPRGPVVAFDRRRGVALSVRWAGARDRVDLGRLLAIPRASSAAEVCFGFRALTTPTFNVVAADAQGHVRYQTAGSVPLRGFRPPPGALPGDGRWEWQGFIPADEMPAWDVPPDGFVVNANNAPVSARVDDRLVGYDFAQDRALRIDERLRGDARLTGADLRSVQNDVESRLARRMLPLLLAGADALPGALDARMRAAVDTLRRWDYVARRSRVGPTLWRAWYGAYLRRSDFEGVSGLAWAALAGRAPEPLTDPRTGRRESPAAASVEALRLGLAELEKLLGPDPRGWWYGRAHRARFRHDLARDLAIAGWEPPPVAEDGDLGTPCVGPSRLPWNPWVRHGPVLRLVVDLAIPDSSWFVLAPGNSGDPASPHARDMLALWAAHGTVPLHLSWARIERLAESELELVPVAPPR